MNSSTYTRHPALPCVSRTQSLYIISPCEFLLNLGFNNCLYETRFQLSMPIQTSMLRSSPIYPTPAQEFLPRCFSSISNFFPDYLFCPQCLISENVISIYHVVHSRKMRAIPDPCRLIWQLVTTCTIKYFNYGWYKPRYTVTVKYIPHLVQKKECKIFQ